MIPISNKRILLVDDSPEDVELAMTALEEYQLANEVITCRDGVEALDFLFRRGEFASRPPGEPMLILLDLKMPKVDGVEVLKQIKNDEKLKTIPVVVMTSSREEQDLSRSYKLGGNAYVVKPLNFHDFIEAVKRLCLFWVVTNEPPPGSGRPLA